MVLFHMDWFCFTAGVLHQNHLVSIGCRGSLGVFGQHCIGCQMGSLVVSQGWVELTHDGFGK